MSHEMVLIVDDEENIRLMLRTALESESYVVKQASNGREALEAIERYRPSLMILDLSMPVMDGMAALQAMKDLPPDRRPPVIVLTAYGSVAKAVQAMRLGASDFLEKPVTPEDLRSAVAAVLKESRNASASDAPPVTYDDVLAQVREALREGEFTDAESLLMKAGSITSEDAAFLNLAGVFHEAMGRKDAARRYYGKAMRADRNYEPAQRNMRRLYELTSLGSTTQRVALGDELIFTTAAEQSSSDGFLARLRKLVTAK